MAYNLSVVSSLHCARTAPYSELPEEVSRCLQSSGQARVVVISHQGRTGACHHSSEQLCILTFIVCAFEPFDNCNLQIEIFGAPKGAGGEGRGMDGKGGGGTGWGSGNSDQRGYPPRLRNISRGFLDLKVV